MCMEANGKGLRSRTYAPPFPFLSFYVDFTKVQMVTSLTADAPLRALESRQYELSQIILWDLLF